MNNEETRDALVRFYGALSRGDGQAMAAMYVPKATFQDEVFTLEGSEIGTMWITLMRRAKDFSVVYSVAQAGNGHGVVEWTARYLFGGRRRVENVILSELDLVDGLIVRQVDRFDFPRWSRQALGLPGLVFGRAAWFRRAVSRKAVRGLGLPART